VVYVMIPRITVAKHCLSLENSDIRKVEFFEGDKSLGSYKVDAKGITYVGDTEGLWFIDKKKLKAKDDEDPCTKYAKGKLSKDDPAISGVKFFDAIDATETKEKISCFTSQTDTFDIISTVEYQARSIKRDSGSNVLAWDSKTAFKSIFDYYKFRKIDVKKWQSIFTNPNARFIPPLNNQYNDLLTDHDNTFFTIFAKDRGEFYQFLDQRLKKISVVSTVVREGEKPYYELAPDRKKGESWRDIIGVFGEDGAGVVWKNSRDTKTFRVDAIALTGEQIPLGKGHSGTMLLGHWLTASKPLLSVYRYNQMFGVLSTVDGDSVCIGDDLTCCENFE
jgi:hypothetical protein